MTNSLVATKGLVYGSADVSACSASRQAGKCSGAPLALLSCGRAGLWLQRPPGTGAA